MKIPKKDKRDSRLFCMIKDSNKKFLLKESKAHGMKLAEFVDALVDAHRRHPKKRRKTI